MTLILHDILSGLIPIWIIKINMPSCSMIDKYLFCFIHGNGNKNCIYTNILLTYEIDQILLLWKLENGMLLEC